MTLTRQEARDVVYDDHNDWEKVKDTEKIVDQRRWTTMLEAVFLHKPTGKHYAIFWEVGSTEQQEQSPFEYDDPVLTEVEEKEVLVKQWVNVK